MSPFGEGKRISWYRHALVIIVSLHYIKMSMFYSLMCLKKVWQQIHRVNYWNEDLQKSLEIIYENPIKSAVYVYFTPKYTY
jgi:hypothetical protein